MSTTEPRQQPTAAETEPRQGSDEAGFTLLELIIVVAIIGILATIAMPAMINAPTKAKEAALRTDLRTFRSVIDQYYGDQGYYPTSLEALVDEGYLRSIPPDPMTKSDETWVAIYEELDFEDVPAETDLPEDGQLGIIDVRSGAEGTTLAGTPYGEL